MLENLEAIQRAYECGWILPTSTLAPLLGISPKSLSREEGAIERFGFRFERGPKQGVEVGWRVLKSSDSSLSPTPTPPTRNRKKASTKIVALPANSDAIA